MWPLLGMDWYVTLRALRSEISTLYVLISVGFMNIYETQFRQKQPSVRWRVRVVS